MNLWDLVKDVVLTGTGVVIIVSQIFSQHPSDALLAVALALTVPSIAGHTKAVLGGSPPDEPKDSGEPESSQPSSSSGS